MTPKEECEALLNHILTITEEFIAKNKEFYPIGMVLKNDDTVSFTATYDGDEFPESDEIIKGITEAHTNMADSNEIKASAIAWNASITNDSGEKSDAIVVSLEHKDNYSVIIGEPYSITPLNEIRYEPIFAQKGKNNIWK